MNSDKYIKYLKQYAGKYIVSDEAADFIFVFKGHVQIKTKDFQQPIDKGEFFIANKGEEVIFTHPSRDSLICLIRIDESLIKNEINIVGFHFLCNSVIQTTIDHTKTKNIVFNLIASEINEDNSIRKKGLYLTFLDSLISKYLIKNASIQTKDDRMNDIIDYIDAYYYKDLSLHQISKNFYMSSSYFSRYFVQETGKNYNKYLKEIRLNKSLELLSNSSEPITQIALQVGFSSAGTFNKSFKEKFHITPTEYRLKSREVVKVPEDFEIGKNLQMSNDLPNDDSFSDLNEDLNEELKKDSNIIEVSLIANQNDKIDFDSNHYMNIGSIDNLIDGTFQSHLKILTKSLHLKGLIVDHLFNFKEFNKSKKINRNYFSNYRNVFDFLISNNYVVLIVIPIESKSFHSIIEMTESLLSFLVNSYTYTNITKFNFILEINDTQCIDSDISIIKELQMKIKDIADDVKFGGPTINLDTLEYYENNVSLLNSVAFDFITCSFIGDQAMQKNISLASYISRIKKLLMQSDKNKAKSISISRYNTTLSDNFLNDSIYKAAQVSNDLIELFTKVETVEYYPVSDFLLNNVEDQKILQGRNGLLTAKGIFKPVFYSFKFMRHLFRYVIKSDVNYIASTDRNNNLTIYIHNLNKENYDAEYIEAFKKNRKVAEINSNGKVIFRFQISNITSGHYEIRQYTIDESNGDINEIWSSWDYKNYLRAGDIDYLSKSAHPNLIIKTTNSIDNQILIEAELDSNAIGIIYIDKVSDNK